MDTNNVGFNIMKEGQRRGKACFLFCKFVDFRPCLTQAFFADDHVVNINRWQSIA
ncbi:hypothetical protein D018_1903A, partial [Vibrio parahaemolyticus VP2007-007]